MDPRPSAHLSLASAPAAPFAPGSRRPPAPRPLFRRSSPPPAPSFAPGELTRARVAAVTDECWCCRTRVRAIVGVLVDPSASPDGSGFLSLTEVDEALVAALDPRSLAGRRIGQLRHRESPGVAGGYIANGCPECDALIGRFHIEDLLTEHRHNGGSYGQLDIGIAVELRLDAAAQRLTSWG
ncbi:MAG TPA: hypothetical protein VFT42_00425 [Solirubrobacteraceae bacterium]|nr:hypothetical protein [Solirubrobacteraceae bacterium]